MTCATCGKDITNKIKYKGRMNDPYECKTCYFMPDLEKLSRESAKEDMSNAVSERWE